jgi:hypothetical protein
MSDVEINTSRYKAITQKGTIYKRRPSTNSDFCLQYNTSPNRKFMISERSDSKPKLFEESWSIIHKNGTLWRYTVEKVEEIYSTMKKIRLEEYQE